MKEDRIIIAGAGGQGIMFLGKIISEAAMLAFQKGYADRALAFLNLPARLLISMSWRSFSFSIYPSYLIFISADSATSLNLSELKAFTFSFPIIFISSDNLTCGREAMLIAFTF